MHLMLLLNMFREPLKLAWVNDMILKSDVVETIGLRVRKLLSLLPTFWKVRLQHNKIQLNNKIFLTW